MKRYYSIKGFATVSFQYQDPLIFVEPGLNAFSVLTDDVDALVERLKADGLRVNEVIALDGSAVHVGSHGS